MEFRLLGPLEAVGDDASPVPLGGKRPRALLAVLLLHANEVVPTDRLIDAVWGERPPATAAGALQVHVHKLRRVLGRDRVATRAPGYLVRVEPGELDVERFTRLVETGGADALRDALALWRGPALADFAYEPFARAEAARLDEARLAALEARIAADLDMGRHAQLVGELDALVGEHPRREGFQAQRMLALYRSGRQTEALEAYRTARASLAELGLEPSPALRTLERRILEHDPSLGPRRPAGEHSARLVSDLIGRDLELAAISAILGRREVRLVTLTGTGGSGKTVLARAAAASYGEHVFVDLAPLSDPALVLATIARAVGVDDDPDATPLELLQSALESNPPLLLLDNLEHLGSAFPHVAELLSSAPAVRILATSRVPLRLSVEYEYRVEPLEVPALGVTSAEDLVNVDSVQLYVERARAAEPAFVLTEANAPHVGRICRALDGLPLAVELAAARVRVLGAEGTARRLGESIAVLSRAAIDLPERQRSLGATITWSYDLLDEDSQAVFRALSIYPAGTALDALETTSDPVSDFPGALERLLDSGLARSQPAGGGEPRFSMLETVRGFALTLLDTDSAATLRDRQLEFVLALVRDAYDARKDDPAAYRRKVTEQDRDNFRAVLTYAAASGRGDELLELCASLNEFWRVTGTLDEGRGWLEQSLAIAPDGHPRLRGRVISSLALMDYTRGRPAEALESVAAAIELLEEHGLAAELGRAYWLRGAAAYGTRDLELSRVSYERAVELLRADGDVVTAGAVVGSLAETYRLLGDLDSAVAAAREAASIAEGAGNREHQAYALAHMARYDLLRHDREGAAEAIVLSLRAASDGGGLWVTAIALLYASQVALSFDRDVDAAVLFGSSHAAFDSVSEERWAAERDEWEPTLEELGVRLGEQLDELLEQGRALQADDAVKRAFGAVPRVGVER